MISDFFSMIFGLIGDVIGLVFDVVFGAVGLVFGLLGGIVSLTLSLGGIALVVALVLYVKKRRTEARSASDAADEDFVSFYDQH